MPIDSTPVALAIIALISAVITTLAPVFITAWFDAHTAKLIAAKALAENNELIAQNAVLLIQQTFGALANSVKLQLAFQRANEALLKMGVNLPPDALRDLLNTAVGAMKLAWGTNWTALGEPKPETPIPDQPIPQETTPTLPVV
jgi:hypothetical protein